MESKLQKKVQRSIKILQSAAKASPDIELCYSGGKDSDVILELARMAGIPFTAIYKNTTIDPPGTINHAKENGVQIVYPNRPFYKIIEAKGFPSRYFRFCCSELKEYKIKDTTILGIRKDESVKRSKIYKEPTQCRIYKRKDHVNQVLPILDWTLQDVQDFIRERGIKLAPHYYREDGTIDFSRRLGCLGCPLSSDNGICDFKRHPKVLRAWLKAGKIWWDTHPNTSNHKRFGDIYEYFAYRTFYEKKKQGITMRNSMSLFPADWKQLLEDYFKIDLTI